MDFSQENNINKKSNIVKKKRGRKPKKKEVVVKSAPKKRGRKPKIRNPEELLPKIPKKRGRKPKDKYGIYTIKKMNRKQIINEEQVILHLPITSKEIQDEESKSSLFAYNPEITEPLPYENENNHQSLLYDNQSCLGKTENTDSNININYYKTELDNKVLECNIDKKIDDDIIIKKIKYEDNNKIVEPKQIISINMRKKEVKIKYNKTNIKNTNSLVRQNFSDNSYWPEKTNIACWWCCHNFSNTPATLPTKYEKGIYSVIGVFCSPECAGAWNFNDKANDSLIWERYSLLNMLYINIYKNINLNIKLAPPKELLEKFGGQLTIEEFRNSCSNYGRDFKLIMPPVKTIIHSINEEANIIIKSKLKKFIPIDKDRINKANEELKLKRNKPLTNHNNTLENCMNLKRM